MLRKMGFPNRYNDKVKVKGKVNLNIKLFRFTDIYRYYKRRVLY